MLARRSKVGHPVAATVVYGCRLGTRAQSKARGEEDINTSACVVRITSVVCDMPGQSCRLVQHRSSPGRSTALPQRACPGGDHPHAGARAALDAWHELMHAAVAGREIDIERLSPHVSGAWDQEHTQRRHTQRCTERNTKHNTQHTAHHRTSFFVCASEPACQGHSSMKSNLLARVLHSSDTVVFKAPTYIKPWVRPRPPLSSRITSRHQAAESLAFGS